MRRERLSEDPPGSASVRFVDDRPLGQAMAWTSDTLAIARGDGLALLTASSGDRAIIDDFVVGAVTCLDFATA